jgi:methylated-DNA-[protein]-cysteine S-methyltransferase
MWQQKLDDYFAGRLKNFAHPISSKGTPFQQKVWQAISEIPAGQVMSYQDIARQIGSGPRAVGGACGKNRAGYHHRTQRVRQGHHAQSA